MSTKSQAFDHNVKWSLASQVEHVDNVFLSETQKDYLASSILAPKIVYEIADAYWQGNLTAADNIRQTSDASFNSDDTFIEAKLLRKNEYGNLSTEFSRQDTTIREVDLVERGQINNDPVIAEAASTTWQYQFSVKDRFSLKGDYVARDYSSKTYTDYSDRKITGLWIHNVTEHLAFQTQLYHDKYNSERADVIATLEPPLVIKSSGYSATTGAQAGFSGKWTSSIYYNVLAGAARVDLTQDTVLLLQDDEQLPFNRDIQNSVKNTNVLSLSSGYKGEKLTLDLNASKQLNASGNGFQYETEQISISGQRRLRQTISINASHTFGKQSVFELGQLTNNRFDRVFTQSQLGFDWQLAHYWFASVWLHYNTQKYQLNPDSAESLSGSLQLRYAPEAIVW